MDKFIPPQNPLIIEVLYQSSDLYSNNCLLSICSLIEKNLEHCDLIVIHIYPVDWDDANLTKLHRIVSQSPKIKLDILPTLNNSALDEISKHFLAYAGSRVTNYKLALLRKLHLIGDRVLYLDSDTVVYGDISELFSQDFSAVQDIRRSRLKIRYNSKANQNLSRANDLSSDCQTLTEPVLAGVAQLSLNTPLREFLSKGVMLNYGVTLFLPPFFKQDVLDEIWSFLNQQVFPFDHDQEFFNRFFIEKAYPLGILDYAYNVNSLLEFDQPSMWRWAGWSNQAVQRLQELSKNYEKIKIFNNAPRGFSSPFILSDINHRRITDYCYNLNEKYELGIIFEEIPPKELAVREKTSVGIFFQGWKANVILLISYFLRKFKIYKKPNL
jgi:lipopolysaccharide biosynthesis glycosyltransferase